MRSGGGGRLADSDPVSLTGYQLDRSAGHDAINAHIVEGGTKHTLHGEGEGAVADQSKGEGGGDQERRILPATAGGGEDPAVAGMGEDDVEPSESPSSTQDVLPP